MVEHSHSPLTWAVRTVLTATTSKDGRSIENTKKLQSRCMSKNEKLLRRLLLCPWKAAGSVPSILVSFFNPPPWHWHYLQVCKRVNSRDRKKFKKKIIGSIIHSSLRRTRVSLSVCTWHFSEIDITEHTFSN